MAFTPLKSSNLDAYDHDAANGVLHVRFKRADGQPGRTYSYRVPPEVAAGLAEAESPGSYFASEIKGKYEAFW